MELEEAYSTLYNLVGAKKEDHFIFTSSGAEGVNHAVFAAYLDITRKTGKNHFVSGSLDEAPAIMAMSRLSELGCLYEMAPANQQGVITAHSVAETLTPRTAMVSLSWANGLTGVIQPVGEIAQLCRDRGILFHVDATHVLGKGYYTLESSGADLLTFDGLPGAGGLFIRDGVEISPFIVGGSEQAHMRAGTVNLPGLTALARSAKEAVRFRDHVCMEIARLRDRFEEIVGKGLFSEQERLPHISAHIFSGTTSDALLYMLNRRGIENASFGGNRFQHLMHILQACGIEGPDIQSGLSFSFSRETTEEEIEKIGERTVEITDHLRRLSHEL
ncbi:MAG: aminotransferase class V-fold PLP-dependent enzyme [Chlamydiales bacterium]|nr:aminotransferase class V-fold PLP-dependent enzyme [Chlamydiales bacterium]